MPNQSAPQTSSAAGRRDTRQRRALREQLDRIGTFVSAQQLREALRANGDQVGQATVYRNLQAMLEAGEVDAVRIDDNEMLYRKCGPRHHHHLVCRSCGRAVEIDGPAVERWAAKAAKDNDFTDVEHVVELFGLCPDCSAATG